MKRRKDRSPSRGPEINGGHGSERRHKKSRSEDKYDYYEPPSRDKRALHAESNKDRELFERSSKPNGILSVIDEKDDVKHKKRTPEVEDRKAEKPTTRALAPESESKSPNIEKPEKEPAEKESKSLKKKPSTTLERSTSTEDKFRTHVLPHLEPAEGQDTKLPRRRAQIKYETQGLERKAEKLREAERWITGGGRSSRR
jgi:hypothetical protein